MFMSIFLTNSSANLFYLKFILIPLKVIFMTNFGLIIRTLLVKGYLIGYYDEKTISKINNQLRPLNMRVKTNHNNKLVLIDTNSEPIKNKQIIENLEQFILNNKKMDKTTSNLFLSLNWIDSKGFTDIFFLQNEEYLLEKYEYYFRKCQYCDILIYGHQKSHDYCQKLYEKQVKKMQLNSN